MAAGPTKEAVSSAMRRVLHRVEKRYGGVYQKATASNYPTLLNETARWHLMVTLLRASNGEACLQFSVDTWNEGGAIINHDSVLGADAAFAAAGIKPL